MEKGFSLAGFEDGGGREACGQEEGRPVGTGNGDLGLWA